jgi:hypothetical protein
MRIARTNRSDAPRRRRASQDSRAEVIEPGDVGVGIGIGIRNNFHGEFVVNLDPDTDSDPEF